MEEHRRKSAGRAKGNVCKPRGGVKNRRRRGAVGVRWTSRERLQRLRLCDERLRRELESHSKRATGFSGERACGAGASAEHQSPLCRDGIWAMDFLGSRRELDGVEK